MKKIKKLNLLLTLLLVIFLTGQQALGQEEGDGSPQCVITGGKSGATVDVNRVAECMENRYGFDRNTMRRFNKKETAPEVEIHYDNTNPLEGEKVTAIAVTKNFKNSVEDLYYTWYLVRSDENGLPIGTMQEGKQRAMGIIARGEYDPQLFGQSYAAGNDIDHDGFWASYGGNDGVGAKPARRGGIGAWDDSDEVACDYAKQSVNTSYITRCYKHNFGIKVFDVDERDTGLGSNDLRSGRDMIINCRHEFPSCEGYVLGDGEFGIGEEECWETDPNNPDTDGDGIEDEADLVGLNQQQFTWKYRPGDYVGVVVEGTSMIPIAEGCEEWEIDNQYWCTHALGAPPAWASWDNVERRLGEGCFETMEELYAACEDEFLVDDLDLGGGNGGGVNGNMNIDINFQANLDDINEGIAQYEACVEGAYQYYTNEQVVENESINSYYKIMWATPDFCAPNHPVYGAGNDGTDPISTHWSFMSGDQCNDQGDVGFGYLAFVPLNEQGSMILDPQLDVLPEDPQFDAVNFGTDQERTDVITVSATTSNPEVDEDFLFYQWYVFKCDEDFVCEDELLEEDGRVVFESFAEGMGVKQFKFRPTLDTFTASEEKVYLQATVVQSEHPILIGGADEDTRNFPIGAIESIVFPVVKKQLSLNFFEAINSGGSLTLGEPICAADGNLLYLDACPVFDYQVIGVQVDYSGPGGILPTDRISWQLNGDPIIRPFDDTVYANAGVLATAAGPVDTIFLPIQGGNKDLQEISIDYKRVDGEVITDLTEGRILAVNNPVAVIEASGADPVLRFDGTPSLNQFEAPAGTSVTLQANIVPDYLTINGGLTMTEHIDPNDLGDQEVHLMWYFNGNFVDQGYIDTHPEFDLSVGGNTLTFTLDDEGIFGTGYEVTARVEKAFNEDHVTMLEDAWKILDTHTITNDNSVTVKIAYDGPIAGNENLKEYLASSIANAPHYLVFSLRLGVAMALVWFILFGFSYAIRLNKNL